MAEISDCGIPSTCKIPACREIRNPFFDEWDLIVNTETLEVIKRNKFFEFEELLGEITKIEKNTIYIRGVSKHKYLRYGEIMQISIPEDEMDKLLKQINL